MFSYILKNTFSMDAKMYSKMPTVFFWLFGLPSITENELYESYCLFECASELEIFSQTLAQENQFVQMCNCDTFVINSPDEKAKFSISNVKTASRLSSGQILCNLNIN